MIKGVKGGSLAVAVVALVLGGCGGGGRSARDNQIAGSAPVVDHDAAKRAPAISPALRKLRASLRKALHKMGPDTGVAVYDLTSHQLLFTWGRDVKRPPASVEKLYTTVAVLKKLGPDARVRTSLLGAGHLGSDGTWHGDLYLRGGGDPTLGDGTFNRVWEYGYGPTEAQLARRLRAAGVRRVTGELIADESLFDTRRGGPQTGYAPDIPDFGGQLSALVFDHGAAASKYTPATFAAKQLAATLKAQHVDVRAATFTRRAPRHARRLASVSSPPMSVLLKLMDIPSDDLFAELLTKQLGVRFRHRGTIAAGAHVIAHVLRDYGIHPRVVDGSGLSRQDSSSPLQVVDLLRQVWHTPEGHVLSRSLPTVGVNGTTRRIARGTPAQGRCIGKTGTLNYVTNLAGYCAARGHRMIAFAIFIDGPANTQAIQMLGWLLGPVARY